MSKLYFVASYPRSGNTWVRMFIFSLMKLAGYLPGSATEAEVETYLPWDATASLYRDATAGDPKGRERLQSRPAVHRYLATGGHPLKVVKSHTLFGSVAGVPLFDPDWRGACYLVRNPLDVAPSLGRLLGVSTDDAISMMERPLYMSRGPTAELWGSWSQNVDSWTASARDDVLVMRYEDLGTSLPNVVGHAGFTTSSEVIAKALDLSSLPALQRLEASGQAYIPTKAGGIFFGGGTVKSYRDKLTPSQAKRIIDAHHLTMKRFGYLTAEALEFAEIKTPAGGPGAVVQ